MDCPQLSKGFRHLSFVADPKVIVDQEGNFLEINDQVSEIIGLDREELVGKNFVSLNIVAPKSNVTLLRNLQKRMRGLVVEPYDIEIKTPNGERKWFEVKAEKTEYEGKTADIVVFHDVTERNKAEKMLRESEEIYRNLCEDAQILMLKIDLKGQVTFVNNEIEKYGFSKNELIGKSLLSLVNGEDRSKLVTAHINAITGKTVEQELQIITPKGAISVDYVTSPIKKEDNIVGCRVIIRDISEKKEMQDQLKNYSLHLEEMVMKQTEELRKSEAELKRYSLQLEGLVEERTKKLRECERMAAIGELATIVGHDLRNPLQSINSAAYYLKKHLPPGSNVRTSEMIEIINSAVKYSNKIVLDLLDYSKELKLDLTRNSPKAIVDGSLSFLEVPGNIQIINNVQTEPAILVDFEKLKQALANIIKNAVDAQPNGGTIILQSQDLKTAIDFVISDKGTGIPQEVLGKLGTPINTTKAKGMGFGLAISKRIVEAHGGTISAETAIGEGTIIKLSIPVAGILVQSP